MGFARLAEQSIRKVRGKGENEKLGAMDKILASSIGGALGCWNQPIEVVRVEVGPRFPLTVTLSLSFSRVLGILSALAGIDDLTCGGAVYPYHQMQSMAKSESKNRPAKLTVFK